MIPKVKLTKAVRREISPKAFKFSKPYEQLGKRRIGYSISGANKTPYGNVKGR